MKSHFNLDSADQLNNQANDLQQYFAEAQRETDLVNNKTKGKIVSTTLSSRLANLVAAGALFSILFIVAVPVLQKFSQGVIDVSMFDMMEIFQG